MRTALAAAAAYRFKPAIGVTLRRLQRDAEPGTLARSRKAQRHLMGQVQDDDGPRQTAGRSHYRGRPRARRVRLGRDDQLTTAGRQPLAMTPAGMTGRTRATTALASQAARRNRWPAGTLAAAGTIPARTMNASATLVFSQGHHRESPICDPGTRI